MSVSLTGMNTTYVRDAEKMYAAAKISIKIDERGCFYGNSNVDESR